MNHQTPSLSDEETHHQQSVVQVEKEDESVEVTKDKEEVLHSMGRPQTDPIQTQKDDLTFAKFCWDKFFCKCLTPLLIVGAVVFGVMKVFDIDLGLGRGDIPFADFIFSRDGWHGLEAKDLPRWKIRGGQGVLRLQMINELEDHWQPYFEQSIQEWNNGDPDVVELTVTKSTYWADSDCDFIRGKFAVCAGNYGDTSFHGVNEILVYGDSISASVAKLNEYYLESATEARKQYTMCHEIGHGFGLPHSDENFYNLNLGNCMDYTDRPWTNTAPDRSTFELLQQIYGNSRSPDNTAGGNVVSSGSTGSGGFSLRGNDNSKDSDDDGPDFIPESIRQRANEAARNLETKFADEDSNEDWVQLHRDDNTAAFEIELGDGFFLQAHFLLAGVDD